jgi:hypothetical protein
VIFKLSNQKLTIKGFQFMIIHSLVFKSSALQEAFTIKHSAFLCKVIYVHYREYFVKIDKKNCYCNYCVNRCSSCAYFTVYDPVSSIGHGGNLIQISYTF